MLHTLILKVTAFQFPPPRRSNTVVKNIWGVSPGGTLNVEVIGMFVGNFFGKP